ncbi:hypothetical protein Tco_0970861 [Tanacetum coccineum]
MAMRWSLYWNKPPTKVLVMKSWYALKGFEEMKRNVRIIKDEKKEALLTLAEGNGSIHICRPHVLKVTPTKPGRMTKPYPLQINDEVDEHVRFRSLKFTRMAKFSRCAKRLCLVDDLKDAQVLNVK